MNGSLNGLLSHLGHGASAQRFDLLRPRVFTCRAGHSTAAAAMNSCWIEISRAVDVLAVGNTSSLLV